MRMFRLFLVAALSLGGACATASSGGGTTPRGDSHTITEAEIAAATQLNVYDLVNAERPRWLQAPGSQGSFPISAYMNDSRLGSPSALRSISLTDLKSIRYYEASAAQQKFNQPNTGPVIQVVTQ